MAAEKPTSRSGSKLTTALQLFVTLAVPFGAVSWMMHDHELGTAVQKLGDAFEGFAHRKVAFAQEELGTLVRWLGTELGPMTDSGHHFEIAGPTSITPGTLADLTGDLKRLGLATESLTEDMKRDILQSGHFDMTSHGLHYRVDVYVRPGTTDVELTSNIARGPLNPGDPVFKDGQWTLSRDYQPVAPPTPATPAVPTTSSEPPKAALSAPTPVAAPTHEPSAHDRALAARHAAEDKYALARANLEKSAASTTEGGYTGVAHPTVGLEATATEISSLKTFLAEKGLTVTDQEAAAIFKSGHYTQGGREYELWKSNFRDVDGALVTDKGTVRLGAYTSIRKP